MEPQVPIRASYDNGTNGTLFRYKSLRSRYERSSTRPVRQPSMRLNRPIRPNYIHATNATPSRYKKTSPDTNGVALPIWNAPLVLLPSQPSLPDRPEPNGAVDTTPKHPRPEAVFVSHGSRMAFPKLGLRACSNTNILEGGKTAKHPTLHMCPIRPRYGHATNATLLRYKQPFHSYEKCSMLHLPTPTCQSSLACK